MTLQVDFDRDLWVYVPTDWPWEQFATLEQWRDALVRALGDAYGYDEPMREWLAATLDGLSRGADPEEHRFAYLARPHEVIGIASIYELEAAPETSLDELLGVEDDAVARRSRGRRSWAADSATGTPRRATSSTRTARSTSSPTGCGVCRIATWS